LLEYASKRALNSAVECHPHTVEVIGSNPIAPTIFSSTCKLQGLWRASTNVQLTHNATLRLPFRRCDGLDVVIHRDTDVGMPHQGLHGCHICPLSFKQRSVSVSEHVPTNALLDTCSQ
jgi:hypothetical protein